MENIHVIVIVCIILLMSLWCGIIYFTNNKSMNSLINSRDKLKLKHVKFNNSKKSILFDKNDPPDMLWQNAKDCVVLKNENKNIF